jgi:hypothetical protein
MFLTLLLVTFAVAIAVALLVSRMFTQPIDMILKRIIADAISAAWLKYMKFAILVVGISSGVRIYELEKYIVPARFDKENKLLELTSSAGYSKYTAPSSRPCKALRGCCCCFLSVH